MAKKKSAAESGKTLVTFLLDRSGSMSSCKDATIEAFNAYVDGLKSSNVDFTFLQFDSISLDKVCVGTPIAQAPALTPKNYDPRGSTPLIDAAVKTINATDLAVKAVGGKPKVVVCIQTDGAENCSTEYTMDHLNRLIKEKSAEGWQFNFMGAGIDAYATSSQMGLVGAQTMSYNQNDLKATRAAFTANANNTAMYASGASMNTHYSAAQKLAAGDAFDPGLGAKAPSGLAAFQNPLPQGPQGNPYQRPVKQPPLKSLVDDLDLTS